MVGPPIPAHSRGPCRHRTRSEERIPMIRLQTMLAAVAGLSTLALASPLAQAHPDQSEDACFYVRDMQNSVVADPRTLYLRALDRVYRVTFQADCNTAQSYTLILHPADNSAQVCKAIELDVHVRDTGESCVPKTITRLTPDEVA